MSDYGRYKNLINKTKSNVFEDLGIKLNSKSKVEISEIPYKKHENNKPSQWMGSHNYDICIPDYKAALVRQIFSHILIL